MTPAAFRRDPSLRASGSLLCLWGGVNAALSLPLWAEVSGDPWSRGAVVALTSISLGVGLWLSILAANRAAKRCGEPALRPLVEARRLWTPLVLAGFVISIPAVSRGSFAALVPVWMAIAGAGYFSWGSFTIGELRGLGAALLVAATGAAITIALEGGAFWLAALWSGAMGLLWGAIGLRIHHRYVRRSHS